MGAGQGSDQDWLYCTLYRPFAAQGKDMSMALQQYLEEIGYQVAGRKIEIIMEDDESNPATALTKTQETGGEGRSPYHDRRDECCRTVMPWHPISTPKEFP